jgi:hypothetical protein
MNTNADKTRKAPAEKANMYEEGYAMDGSDGMLYIVKADKNGFKRWAKQTTTKSKTSSEKKSEPEQPEEKSEPEQPEPEEKSEPEPEEKKKSEKKKKKAEKQKPKKGKKAEESPVQSEAEEEAAEAPPPKVEKKKKSTRKAPAEKASAHDEGYQTDGSDGNPYIVKADKNGIKKWMKQKVTTEDEKPKRAPTAYTNFIKVTLPELRKKHADKKAPERMTMAGAIWSSLSEDEKKAFLA